MKDDAAIQEIELAAARRRVRQLENLIRAIRNHIKVDTPGARYDGLITDLVLAGEDYDKAPQMAQWRMAREQSAYPNFCRNPDACRGKGYCPLDPTCAD